MSADGMTREFTRTLKTQLSLAQLAIAQPSFPDEESVSVVDNLLTNAKEMLVAIRALAGLPSPAGAGEGPGVRE